MESANHVDKDPELSNSGRKRGGWITTFFIIGSCGGFTLAGQGWLTNIIVFLIEEFNIKSIQAAQISNVINGLINLLPVVAAILADSIGCFSVIAVSSYISSVGLLLLGLIPILKSLMPPPCETGSSLCKGPSAIQSMVLYVGIALASIGMGSTRYTTATMGANQFNEKKDQDIFFNWYFFTVYTASLVSTTAIVYIEASVSWAWGFGLCFGAHVIGLCIFLAGKRFYHHVKPQGSPFVVIARVVVAAFRKRNVPLPTTSENFYFGNSVHLEAKEITITPTKGFRFLNRAAVKTEGDIDSDGSIARPWRLCTVQQVEDFKIIIRILPLLSTSLIISITAAIQFSMVVLQALVMDRRLGPHFKIPAASFSVINFLSCSISLTIIDRFLFPTWQKLAGHYPTPFQRIGIGHVLNIISMVVTAVVEKQRLDKAREYHLQEQQGSVVPMSALWLFPQLVIFGLGSAFHFPGQVALYYQEFPVTLRNTATATSAMVIGISFYLGTALIDLVQRVTKWLPDDINNGRLDYVYWVLVVMDVLNLGYYLTCARLYKPQNVAKEADNGET